MAISSVLRRNFLSEGESAGADVVDSSSTARANARSGAVAFRNLGKVYHSSAGEVPALQYIDLDIEAGSIFGIIGRSGAGKSSLLRTINRLERPTSGQVLVDGVDIGTLNESGLVQLRRRIGMIFQHFNLLSAKTVWENVALPLKVAGVPPYQIHQRVTELLTLVGLQDKHRTFPSRLSGGQKQRVGIARALATGPEILLCDEATSALDPETTQAILQLLRDINRRLGITVILITHEMSVIREIADRVLVLEKGQIAENNYDNMIIIPILKANQMAQGRGLRYELTIGINDPTQMEYAMGEATGLMRAIRHDRLGEPNSFELEKSETLAQELEAITGALRLGGFGVGFITLLGASIALMNIMLVSVTERTREVGVRKALGATPLRIRQQFVIEAIVVCLLGGIAGVILGILIGNLMSMAMGIDAFVVPWLWIFVGFMVCIIVGLLSGWYPARKASMLDPIESLRFE